jgi:rubrerythrin
MSNSMNKNHRDRLIDILLLAYSGELAAAHAYRGHWRSVKSPSEKRGIQKIEREEWVHRRHVGKMLRKLGRDPEKLREFKMGAIGRTIGFFCHVGGWFLPMYFAGRLEHGNVKEYDVAAHHAGRLGLRKFKEQLLRMSRTEREHELFFLSMVLEHPLLPFTQFLFRWGPAAGRTTAGKT